VHQRRGVVSSPDLARGHRPSSAPHPHSAGRDQDQPQPQSAEPHRGRLGKKNTAPRQTTSGPAQREIRWLWREQHMSLVATNRSRAAPRAVRGMTQCPLATGMTKISRPSGKYSVHQAAPKHLTNNSPALQRVNQLRESAEPWGPVSCHHSRRLKPIVSALTCVLLLFIPDQDSTSYKLALHRSNSRHR
jgi:hypothetical protein